MGKMTQHQRNVAAALEGNERVFFHPFEDRIAVWCGGAHVSFYDSETWEIIEEEHIVPEAGTSVSERETAVTVELVNRGFSRRGRGKHSTKVVERKA